MKFIGIDSNLPKLHLSKVCCFLSWFVETEILIHAAQICVNLFESTDYELRNVRLLNFVTRNLQFMITSSASWGRQIKLLSGERPYPLLRS